MLIIKTKQEMQDKAYQLRKAGKTIGFVPTMGYLHAGHLQLVEEARKKTDIVIVSIYVNPTQFSQNEDFSRYPRDHGRDLKSLAAEQTDIVFLPEEKSIYNRDHLTWVEVDSMSNLLCGKSRKGHFRGVTTVVLKLINLVSPDYMFMGEKDYQQLVILEKMVEDLDLPVKIVRCPTVREEDGLAMSSRNSYLSAENRKNAASLYHALTQARDSYRKGVVDSKRIISEISLYIENRSGKIDYVDVVDSRTLTSLPQLEKGCRITLAVFFDETRLIDNIEVS